MKRGRPKGSIDAATPARATQMAELRCQGLSYRAIGEQCGVSGERVRQLLVAYAPEVVAARYSPRICPCCKQSFVPNKHSRSSQVYCSPECYREFTIVPHIHSLARTVCAWLATIEHGRCHICKAIKPFGEMTNLGSRHSLQVCRLCNVAKMTAYVQTPKGKAYVARGNRSDAAKRARKKYRESHRDQLRAKRQALSTT